MSDKPIIEACLDCLKQLAPDLAASGAYELLTSLFAKSAATGVAAAASAVNPVAIGAFSIGLLGYLGLKRRSNLKEKTESQRASDLLRRLVSSNAQDHSNLREDLTSFGIDLTLD